MFDFQKLASSALDFANNPRLGINAIITFEVSTGETIETDDIGNIILVPSSTTVTLKASLRQTPSDRFTNDQRNRVGVDQAVNYYQGRLIEPKEYDFPIIAIGDITVTLDGRKGRATELVTIPTSSAREFGITENLGQRIQMFIEFQQGN